MLNLSTAERLALPDLATAAKAILLEVGEMSDEEAESALAGVGGVFEPATATVR